MKLKYVIVIIVIASAASILYGFNIKEESEAIGNKYIGVGTIGLFLIAMPLFLIKESKGKKMEDYMLTKENIEKMRKKESKVKKNSQ
jgi:uncharacterized membrane protein